MKIFLRIEYPHGASHDAKESFGINTANTEFFVNLIKYSRKIEQFGLLVTKPSEEKRLKELFPDKIINGHTFRDQKELANVLQSYDIFFMGDYAIGDILKCQSFFHKGLSVIGITHSIHLEEVVRSLNELSSTCTEKDALICTSSAAVNAVHNMVKGTINKLRVERIPLGTDVERYYPIDEGTKRGLRARFGLPEDEIIFLCLGRLSPDEKMELAPLLKAFADLVRVSESGENARLLIVGREHNDGYVNILLDLAGKLEIQDRLRIISDYEASDIPLYYGMADVFVSPSDNIQETFGLSVIEAMASGLPAIVSDWDGYRDTVVDGDTGFLIPTYWADCGFSWGQRFQLAQSVAVDMDRLIECMQALLKDKGLRKKMSKSARDRAESKFSWKKVISQYDVLFQEVVSGARGKPKINSEEFVEPSNISMKPADIFYDYPTYFLNKEFRIKLRDINGFTGYSNVSQLVDVDVVNHIANLIVGDITRLGDITDVLEQRHDKPVPVHKALFQIMLMMKCGVFAPAD